MLAKVGTKQAEGLEECYFACCFSCVSKGGHKQAEGLEECYFAYCFSCEAKVGSKKAGDFQGVFVCSLPCPVHKLPAPKRVKIGKFFVIYL